MRVLYVDSVQLETASSYNANSGFETDTSGWGGFGYGTVSKSNTQAYTGSSSLQVDTSSYSGSSEGAVATAGVVLPNTVYSVSMMVRLDGTTAPSKGFNLIYRFSSDDYINGITCDSKTLTADTWTKMSCIFKTGPMVNLGPFVGITTLDSGDFFTTYRFYIDDAVVAPVRWTSNDAGRISLNGSIDSPLTVRGQDSTNALQIEQQNGQSVLTVDTLNGRVGINTETPSKELQVNGGVLITETTATANDTFKIQGTTSSNNSAFRVWANGKFVYVGDSTNTTNASLNVYGVSTFTPKINSTNAFRVQNNAGSNLLQVDSTNQIIRFGAGAGTFTHNINAQSTDIQADGGFNVNTSSGQSLSFDPTAFSVGDTSGLAYDFSTNRVGIGASYLTPGYTLDVDGDINTTGVYRVGDTAGVSSTCSGGQVLLNPVLLGGLTTNGTCTTAGTVASIGAIDSQAKSANGAVISGNTLVLQSADATSPGLVTTGTQTFAGDKTFGSSATSGNAFVVNANSLTTGLAFQVTGPSSNNLVRVKNDNTQGYNKAQMIVGQGDVNNPDTLARDQLYVFGRINSSWNQMWADCLTSEGTKNSATTATGVYGASYSGSATTGRLSQGSVSGVSGVCRFNFATPATNATTYFGSGGAATTLRTLNPVFESRVMSDNNIDHRNIVGFTNMGANTAINADTNNSTQEAFFRKSASGTSWETVTRDGGTEQITTNVGSTNAWHRLRVEIDDSNAEVRFYVDGTLVATHTTVPSGQIGFTLGNNVTSTTSRTFDVDYLRVWSDDPVTALTNNSVNSAESTEVATLDTTSDEATDDSSFSDSSIQPEEGSNEELLKRIGILEQEVSTINLSGGGLTIDGTATFNGDSIFNKVARFFDKVIFGKDVEFDGRPSFNNDTGGFAEIKSGQQEIRVSFSRPYNSMPVVTVNVKNGKFVQYAYKDLDENGFTIVLDQQATSSVEFSWTALDINGAQTASK